MTESLAEYIARAKERNPIATKILHKIWAALKDAGNPIVTVYDGEDYTAVITRKDVDMQVFNLDDCYLLTKSGGWVRFVPENEWDSIVDYTVSLDEILAPVNAYIERFSD